jgi:tetratricopeptide (TPR) repeat protein
MGLGSFWGGRWEEALSYFERAVELDVRGPAAGYGAPLFLTHAYLGNRVEALDGFARLRSEFAVAGQPNSTTAWSNALMAIEAFAILGESNDAAALYPIAEDAVARGTVGRGLDWRLNHTMAGIAASCAAEWDRAGEHFNEAIRLARNLPIRIEEPEILRFHAGMFLERRHGGDRERADQLLVRAMELYRGIGMPAHVSLASAARFRR